MQRKTSVEEKGGKRLEGTSQNCTDKTGDMGIAVC